MWYLVSIRELKPRVVYKQGEYSENLVSVDVGLEGALNGETKVLGLNGGELGELNVAVSKMEPGDLLVEDLGEDVDANVELLGLSELNVLLAPSLVVALVEHDLGKDLVGEGAGHDERGVTSGTAEVDETALSKKDDVPAVLEEEAVNLGLDVLDALGVGLEPGNVDFDIEVTNVADNGVVGHGLEVGADEDVSAASGSDEDLTNGSGLLHGSDLEASHGSLEGVDGVDLSDDDAGTHASKGDGAALADITVTGNNGDLASNHDIGGTLDTVNEGLTATVQVVKLGLGDGVVDVDGGDEELASLEHSVEVVNTSGGLLGDTIAALEHLGVLLVDEGGEVTAVIENEVEGLAILEGLELLLEAPVVLILGLTLPGEDGDTGGGNGSSGVVLGGEDVARGPGDLSTERGEGLDEDGSLDGHVKAASNASALKRLIRGVLLTDGHETGHLVLSELNLLAAKGREGEVGDLERVSGSRHCEGWVKCVCMGWRVERMQSLVSTRRMIEM